MRGAVTFSGCRETYAAVGSDSEALPVYVIGRGRPKPAGRLTFPACLWFMSYARERHPLKRRSEAWVVRNIGRIDPKRRLLLQNALVTQPTTLRLNASSTVANYRKPSWVGT